MNVRFILANALALGLVANAANATVYFDSTMLPSVGTDGQPGSSYAAGSFTASSPDFTQVSLVLDATNPTASGGSVMVYLVADNGSGAANGVSGVPDSLIFGNYAILGTIHAASLSASLSLVTLNVSSSEASSVASETQNDEYWVELVFSPGSSIGWSYTPDPTNEAAGMGLVNQATVNTDYPTNGPDSEGAYAMTVDGPGTTGIVDTPEPTSLAILGGALASLGYFRRRSAKAR